MPRLSYHVLLLTLTVFVLPAFSNPPNVRFVDVTEEARLEFKHFTGAFGKRYMPETMGSGCAFLDFDNDARLDILLINGMSWKNSETSPTSKLYRNVGNDRFVDVTDAANLAVPMYGMGTAIADYDNDGDADIYITSIKRNRLFRNDADGTFTDVTDTAAVGGDSWSTSALFFDYDRDGWLDLFVCNFIRWSKKLEIPCVVDDQFFFYCPPFAYGGRSCRLYRNLGNGTFEDVTVGAGLYNPKGKSLGVTMLDYDDDGWIDLAVANDTEPNFLYRNNGDGTFTDEAVMRGVATSEKGMARAGMGIDASDVKNDGGVALAIGNFSNEMTAFFYANKNQEFIDLARSANLGSASLLALTFGLFFFDFDLDGHSDLFCVNGHIEPDIAKSQSNLSYAQQPSLFRNKGNLEFADVSDIVGFGYPGVGRGAAYGDYDGDGDLDVLVSNNGVLPEYGGASLFRNEGGNRMNFLRVKTIGTRSNRDGIGAKVVLTTGNATQRKMVRTGGSYCSQSETTLTFGLGNAELVESLEIIWHSGQVDRHTNLAPNRLITVIEGATSVGGNSDSR